MRTWGWTCCWPRRPASRRLGCGGAARGPHPSRPAPPADTNRPGCLLRPGPSFGRHTSRDTMRLRALHGLARPHRLGDAAGVLRPHDRGPGGEPRELRFAQFDQSNCSIVANGWGWDVRCRHCGTGACIAPPVHISLIACSGAQGLHAFRSRSSPARGCREYLNKRVSILVSSMRLAAGAASPAASPAAPLPSNQAAPCKSTPAQRVAAWRLRWPASLICGAGQN